MNPQDPLRLALRGSRATGLDLLVLLAIADHSNADGLAWPALETIAQRCGVNEKTVRRALPKLEALGEIKIESRRAPEKGLGRRSLYTVNLEQLELSASQRGRLSGLTVRSTEQRSDPSGLTVRSNEVASESERTLAVNLTGPTVQRSSTNEVTTELLNAAKKFGQRGWREASRGLSAPAKAVAEDLGWPTVCALEHVDLVDLVEESRGRGAEAS